MLEQLRHPLLLVSFAIKTKTDSFLMTAGWVTAEMNRERENENKKEADAAERKRNSKHLNGNLKHLSQQKSLFAAHHRFWLHRITSHTAFPFLKSITAPHLQTKVSYHARWP